MSNQDRALRAELRAQGLDSSESSGDDDDNGNSRQNRPPLVPNKKSRKAQKSMFRKKTASKMRSDADYALVNSHTRSSPSYFRSVAAKSLSSANVDEKISLQTSTPPPPRPKHAPVQQANRKIRQPRVRTNRSAPPPQQQQQQEPTPSTNQPQSSLISQFFSRSRSRSRTPPPS